MSVSNRIRTLRMEQHLLQEDIAHAVGSCSRTISRIERGVCNPSLEMALRIAQYLKVPVEELFQVDDLFSP